MKPSEVGFDGAKGLSVGEGPHRSIFKLKRGKTIPDPRREDFKNQLLWFYPDNQDPKLIYCNQDNQLFELNFVPTEDWILSLETE
jgi:hypothetical protein